MGWPRHTVVAIAAIASCATASQIHAQEIEIIGTWSGDITLLLEVDDKIVEAPREWKLVIDEQNGSLLRGFHQWRATTDDPGNVAGRDVLGAEEHFIGAIDGDRSTIRLVETDDFGMLFIEVLNPNKIEATYMETHPNAVVFTSVLRRDGSN